MNWSPQECVTALKTAANRLNKSPTKAEYEQLGITPASSTIVRVVGSWNEAKELAGLETNSQTEGGGQPINPKPDDIDLPDGYVWEELSPQQRWYYQNRAHRISVKMQRERNLRLWFYELKQEVYACTECGETHPGCIDFHHIGPKQKDVSKMVNHGYSKDRILAELEHCVPLCANCHNKEHIEYPGWWNRVDPPTEADDSRTLRPYPRWSDMDSKEEYRGNIRSWLYEYKWHSEGCSRCEESHPSCLEFHHIDDSDKSASINDLVLQRQPLDRMMAEIEKCDLICRNCHRKEHYEPPERKVKSSDTASQH